MEEEEQEEGADANSDEGNDGPMSPLTPGTVSGQLESPPKRAGGRSRPAALGGVGSRLAAAELEAEEELGLTTNNDDGGDSDTDGEQDGEGEGGDRMTALTTPKTLKTLDSQRSFMSRSDSLGKHHSRAAFLKRSATHDGKRDDHSDTVNSSDALFGVPLSKRELKQVTVGCC